MGAAGEAARSRERTPEASRDSISARRPTRRGPRAWPGDSGTRARSIHRCRGRILETGVAVRRRLQPIRCPGTAARATGCGRLAFRALREWTLDRDAWTLDSRKVWVADGSIETS